MRGLCPSHIGRSPLVGAQRGEVNWTFRAWRNIRTQPAIDADGTIVFGSDRRRLHALHPDGSLAWEVSVGASIESSPAIGANGLIYFGSNDWRVYAVSRTGQIVHRHHTWGRVQSSPVIGAGGVVYVGSNDRRIYAFHSDLSVKWSFRTGGRVRSSPAIGTNGLVYVGSDDGSVYALDAETGTVAWSVGTGAAVRSSPALSASSAVYVGSDDGHVYALEGDNGSVRWRFDAGGKVRSSPAIDPDRGTIYVGSSSRRLFALVDSGNAPDLRWEAETGGRIVSSPAIGKDGVVYVGSDDKRVRAFEPDTGQVLWSVRTSWKVRSSPVIGTDGAVLVGSDDHRLYSIGRFDNALVLLEDVSIVPDRGPVAQPALEQDGVTPNPDGLQSVRVRFTQPVDPASFSLASNVEVRVHSAGATGLPPIPDSEAFFTEAAFSSDGREAELRMDPAKVVHGGQYTFAIDTRGLRLPTDPPTEVGVHARAEVRAVRVTVLRPDGTPPRVIEADPPSGAVGIPPHAELRLLFSELMDDVPLQVSVGGSAGGQSALRLFQTVDRTGTVPRTVLSSIPGQRLLLDTEYTVTLPSERTLDLSGERLAPGDFVWTFRTSPIRIERPAAGHRIAAGELQVSGLVALSFTEAIVIELHGPSGEVIAGPVTATRPGGSQTVGGVAVEPFTASLLLSGSAPAGSRLFAASGGLRDVVVLDEELAPDASQPGETEPCTELGCTGAPRPEVSSPDDPVIVVRDNPTYNGALRLREGESMLNNSQKYRWPEFGFGPAGRFSSALRIAQPTEEGHLALLASPPLMPGGDPGALFEGPLPEALWAVRGTRLQHDHVYTVWPAMTRFDAAGEIIDITESSSTLHLRLSDEVLLVPVVIVTWWNNGAGQEETARLNALRYKELFDYVPGQSPAIDQSTIRTGSPPDAREIPPDDIWSQCGIQFQVIEVLTAENVRIDGPPCLPGAWSEFTSSSLDNGLDYVARQFDREKAERLKALRPIVAEIAPIHCAFHGKKSGPRAITIDTSRECRSVTAHELGHVLEESNLHCDDREPVEDCMARRDLMMAASCWSTHEPPTAPVTIASCETARNQARKLSDAFREYNLRFGPALRERVCCDVGGGETQVMPAAHCSFFDRIAPAEECPEPPPDPGPGIPDGGLLPPQVPRECCLLDGEFENVDEGTCAGEVRPLEECGPVR